MCALLKPIDPRLLAHSVTVFNALAPAGSGAGTQYLATVIRKVSFVEGGTYSFKQSGTSAADQFRLVICCANSDFGSRVYAPVLEWMRLPYVEQTSGRFTLHRDMWLCGGECSEFPDGSIVPAAQITPKYFAGRGLRLLKSAVFRQSGLDRAHHFTLEG